MTNILHAFRKIVMRWMPQNSLHDRWTLMQVMAWWHQLTGHYHNQCWPSSLLQYDTMRLQSVNQTYLCQDRFSSNHVYIFSPGSWLQYLCGSPHLNCNNIVFCPIRVLSYNPNGNWHEFDEVIIWNQKGIILSKNLISRDCIYKYHIMNHCRNVDYLYDWYLT